MMTAIPNDHLARALLDDRLQRARHDRLVLAGTRLRRAERHARAVRREVSEARARLAAASVG